MTKHVDPKDRPFSKPEIIHEYNELMKKADKEYQAYLDILRTLPEVEEEPSHYYIERDTNHPMTLVFD